MLLLFSINHDFILYNSLVTKLTIFKSNIPNSNIINYILDIFLHTILH